MKPNKYPKGSVRKCKPQGLCKICGKPQADSRFDVQINQFRGDDEVYKVHKACIAGLGDKWTTLILHGEVSTAT